MRKERLFGFICSLGITLAIVVLPTLAMATTYYVDDDHGNPYPGTGTYSDPFHRIQTGITAASYGDTVRVATGTYDENILLKNGVRVIGGMPPVTIDGGGFDSAVKAINVGSATVLDGFIITNGDATNGGGMYLENASPQVKYCTFSNNEAWNGGGMYNDDSSPTVTDSKFLNNNSTFGGGIFNDNSSPQVSRCTFENNVAYQALPVGCGPSYGGGMANTLDSSPIVDDSLFKDNFACQEGGGMWNNESSPTVRNSTFVNNHTNLIGGGILNQDSSSPDVINTVFTLNYALEGGAMYNEGSSPTVTNSTFYNNRATSGGADAGGIYNHNSSPTVTNTILWADSPDEIYNWGTSAPVVTYSDIQGGYGVAADHNIDANPLFVDPGAENFHLQSGSPAIDEGNNSAVYPPYTDFEGDDRRLDGDSDGTATVDMGADEATYYVDLSVLSIVTDPVSPVAGQPVDIEVTVRNNGTGTTGGFYIDWYAHLLSPPSTHQVGDKAEFAGSLAAVSTHTMSKSYTYATAGDYRMYAQVDTDEHIVESNESNNIRGPQIIHVVAPSPPVIDGTAVDGCISELCKSTLSVTAHDPAGGTLSYAWTANGGAIIGTGSSVLFDPPDSGPHLCPYYKVKVTVTSSVSGLSTSQTIPITVKLAGDVDGNGVVNVLDKLQVRNHFGESGLPGWIDADVNCDGSVNVLDKMKVRNQFGESGCACP